MSGILSKGHLTETDQSYFVGQHIGKPIKTKKVLESADGVLFIDEACNLCSSISKQVLILKQFYYFEHMEDKKTTVWGKEYEMFNFLETNPGLKVIQFFNFPRLLWERIIRNIIKTFIRSRLSNKWWNKKVIEELFISNIWI